MSDAGTDHYGLRIMKERAAEIGAQLSISSQTNQGTKIHLLWKKTGQEEMKAEG